MIRRNKLKEMNLLDTKVSKLVEMLFEIYRGIFANDVETEEEALFAKALIDFNIRTLASTLQLGVKEKTLPIADISVWQGITHGEENLFKIRVETVGGIPGIENGLPLLVEKVNDAIKEWGDVTFGGVVSIDDKDINPEGISWVVDKKNENK